MTLVFLQKLLFFSFKILPVPIFKKELRKGHVAYKKKYALWEKKDICI